MLDNGALWFGAGISLTSIGGVGKEKRFALAAAVLGTVGALLFPMDNITDFLYFIGSVFAPMAGVLVGSVLVAGRDFYRETVSGKNLLVWLLGFLLYRYLMTVNLPIGCTLPDVVLVTVVTALVQNKRRA